MKKLLFVFTLTVLSFQINAQFTATTSIQFYIDANSNCTYDPAEQLIYSVPKMLTYATSSGSTATVYSNMGDTASSCNLSTIYLWDAATVIPVSNTLIIPQGLGLTPNLTCNSYNNIPYSTNPINYLPVNLTTTSTVGASINFLYTGPNNFNGAFYNNPAIPGNTMGVCSNIGNDQVVMYITVSNFMNCNTTTSATPRTYSLYLDGVNYEQITTTGPFGSSINNAPGINAISYLTEYYTSSTSMLILSTGFPTTFTTLGTHTFEIRSSAIYGNPQSVLNFSQVINSVPCSKISGQFYNDCNSNCTEDAGDGYALTSLVLGRVYNSTTGVDIIFGPNNYDGTFSVFLPSTAAYSLSQYPSLFFPTYNFTPCTTGTITIPAGASTNTFSFGYQSNGMQSADANLLLQRMSSTSSIISPGVGCTFGVRVSSSLWGMCSLPGVNPAQLKVTLPKFINYTGMVSGSTPTVVVGSTIDTLIWSIPDISTYTNNIFGTFSTVVSVTAVPNSTFAIIASIIPASDSYTLNNTYNWTRTIDGPFDPNGKVTEATGLQTNGNVTFGTNQFFYTIGFQNIGKAPAINVVTLDTIDASFDLSTLRVLQSSFPVSTQIDQNSRLAAFHFDGINLPGVLTDEPGSHGFVRYTIKLKPNIPVNTVLKNRAHNYFDFNEPVATNQTSNKLVILTTAINENGQVESTVKAIPNPFNTNLKIISEKGIEKIRVFNMLGALMLEASSSATEALINFENLPSAIYLVKVTSVTGSISTIKVIKE